MVARKVVSLHAFKLLRKSHELERLMNAVPFDREKFITAVAELDEMWAEVSATVQAEFEAIQSTSTKKKGKSDA